MLLRLQSAVPSDVLEREPACGEYAADEEPPMAVLRTLLTAQHRHAIGVSAASEAFDPGLKPLRLGDEVVPNVTLVVVELRFVRTTAELIADEHVANTDSGKMTIKDRSVVLRRVSRFRNGTDVGNDGNLMLREQLDEVLARMVRVTDGVQVATRLAR